MGSWSGSGVPIGGEERALIPSAGGSEGPELESIIINRH